MLRAVPYKGGCWRSNWHNPTTQGTPGVCGAGPIHSTFPALKEVEQIVTREDAEERYLSYAFLRQRGTQHGNLKVDLQNDFTTGDNRYPKNRQQTLHLLNKYSKTVVQRMTQSKGTSFVQLSYCNCRGGAESVGGSWGIGCPFYRSTFRFPCWVPLCLREA